MSRKKIGTGLVLFGLIGVGVMVMENEGRFPRTSSSPPSSPMSSQASETSVAGIQTASVEVVSVSSQFLEEIIPLSGELIPFLSVNLSPKISGIVDSVKVDRGSMVKKGDVLIQLRAPELQAQRREAEAQLRGATITYKRLRSAGSTPGIVAGHDLELAQHNQEALKARLQSLEEMEKYLTVVAPFDGVITQRNIHPGAVVGPGQGGVQASPLVRLEQIGQLRLIVPVPEVYVGSITQGSPVPFVVPAYPHDTFSGVVSRISQSVDSKTRSMPVEIDVPNPDHRLAAGMFPEVRWPIRGASPTLFVPSTSVVATAEGTFVLHVKDHIVDWVPVRKGTKSGSMIEVFGSLQAGDSVVLRGTDELRPGSVINPLPIRQGS